MRKTAILTALFLAIGFVTSARTQPAAGASPTPAEIHAIVKHAYVYGVPMISLYATLYAVSIDKGNPEHKGPFNSILNVARVFTPDGGQSCHRQSRISSRSGQCPAMWICGYAGDLTEPPAVQGPPSSVPPEI